MAEESFFQKISGDGKASPVIAIDKEGNWFYDGSPIINKKIYLFFNQHLEKTPEGKYQLRVGGETCEVFVEDTPNVIIDVELVSSLQKERDFFKITLNDETEEQLDVASLSIGTGNVLYCTVKGGAFKARFLRPSYYRLAAHIVQDENGRFYLPLNGKRFYISGPT